MCTIGTRGGRVATCHRDGHREKLNTLKTTLFSNVDWIVAWDNGRDRHTYLRGGDLVFRDNEITFVGKGYDGDRDQVIDGAGLCLIPGWIDIHSHPCSELFYRGIREDHSVPEHYMTGLYERTCAFYPLDEDLLQLGAEVSYSELLLSGVTTLVDITGPYPGWVDVMERSGLRMYAAPGFSTSMWRIENQHQLKFNVDIENGKKNFEASLKLIDELVDHPCGRLSGVVSPWQIENCIPALLVESRDAAKERGLPWTTHAAQAIMEFNLIVDRYGKTPIQFLDELGLLGPGTILGHAIFIDEHSWIQWHSKIDLKLLGDSGTSVAHCPTPFMRYGPALEHFSRYVDAGVNMGIGTDTFPHNMIEEMRSAAILGRVTSRDGRLATTSEVVHAGTVGGAKALLRDDLGKLTPGAKADMVVIDLNHPVMMPVRDPLRSLIHSAAERAVKDVYIDGRQVVKDHEVLTLSHQEAAQHLAEGQAIMEAKVPSRDYAGRSSLDISPLSLPVAD